MFHIKRSVVQHNNLQFEVTLKKIQMDLSLEHIMWLSAAVFNDLEAFINKLQGTVPVFFIKVNMQQMNRR